MRDAELIALDHLEKEVRPKFSLDANQLCPEGEWFRRSVFGFSLRGDRLVHGAVRLAPASDGLGTVAMLGWLALFFIVIWLLGFIEAAPVVTFPLSQNRGPREWRTSIILALLS